MIDNTPESKESGPGNIDQGRVIETANRIGEFYHLPQEIIERGRSTQVRLVSGQELTQGVRDYYQEVAEYRKHHPIRKTKSEQTFEKEIGFDAQSVGELDLISEEHIKEEIEGASGVFIPRQDGRRIILLEHDPQKDQEMVEDEIGHELVHSMSCNGFEQTTGFHLRLFNGRSYFWQLDEAATELLRSTESFVHRISNSGQLPVSLNFGYKDYLVALMQGLNASTLTVFDLARYYFGIKADEDRAFEFIVEAMSNPKPGQEKAVGDLLFNAFFLGLTK